MAKQNINIVTDGDIHPLYSEGLKIATIGGKLNSSTGEYEGDDAKHIYIPDETKLIVTLLTQDGKPTTGITGVTVIVHNGSDASAPIAHEKAYNNQPVEFDVGEGFQYYVEVVGTLEGHFNPHVTTGTQTGIAGSDTTYVTFTYDDVSHVSTLSSLKTALDAGAGTNLVGCIISDTWTNENGTVYNSPWIVTAVKTYVGADGENHTGAKLVRMYANENNVQFDAANQEVATETTAQAGVYYYGWANKYDAETTYAKDVVIQYGGSLYISLIKDNVGNVPAGATDSYWKLLTTTPSTYTSYSTGGLTLLSNLKEGDSLPTTYVKIFKNAVSDSSRNIILYGHNRYLTSAIRQYLNSDASKGAWWTQQHVGQMAPSALSTLRGWKAGCSVEILKYAKPVHFKTYGNDVCDGSVIDDICSDDDIFFLDSGTEVYGSVNDNEGTSDEYWEKASGFSSKSNSATNGRIHYRLNINGTGSACYVWLRSPLRCYSYYAWHVYTDGGLSYASAYNTGLSAAPACVIY